ncbi:OmpA family protein [Craterilacuibacter sinensis]|uniref:OmpA family protein n=1 Tax=Craterilacuibacter sinensis TaxID=2686017 RepID=A0A845BMM4_9NEIS|nr:OmpA family protein [Craterilacuibacter sinensis]MXR35701.1 OmpA family protein [Craterilacuibacter sinensis]
MSKLSLRLTATVVAGALALTACTTNPMTGQSEMNKTATYGLGGAAVCGAIGALVSGSKGARNAALACGAIGAGVGVYMDNQEKELRAKLANTQVQVNRVGDQIKLVMPENITFALNSASLNSGAQRSLADVAGVLNQYPETTITVNGYTDSTGALAYNMKLSRERAQSVANILRNNGVGGSRIATQGYGPESPVASNATAAGRAQNRRVEILINPKPQ